MTSIYARIEMCDSYSQVCLAMATAMWNLRHRNQLLELAQVWNRMAREEEAAEFADEPDEPDQLCAAE